MRESLKVFGPPGTGKTWFLLQKLEEELKRTRPYRIAFLTFTRTARAEAFQRAKMEEKDLPFLRTIHAICYRQMSVSQSQMIKPKMLREFGIQIGTEITGWLPSVETEELNFGQDTKPTKADILLQLNHLGRHRKVGLREMLRTANEELEWEFSKWFTETYRKWKDAESLFDFTDLLSVYLQYGQPLPIDVMFVDEAQDLSRLQWDVVRKLGANAQRVYIAGDDDQAIFTWAGASAEAFIKEPASDQVILDQSYRCPKAVMKVAHEIIANVKTRVGKSTKPREAEGLFETVGYLDRSMLDREERTLLLYRNHHRGKALAKELEDMSVPYLGGSSPLSDKDVAKTLTAWNKTIKGERSTPAELGAFLGMCDQQYLVRNAEDLAETPRLASELIKFWPDDIFCVLNRIPKKNYVQRVYETYGVNKMLSPSLTLQSIHQSKGQEAHTVILDTELAKKTYDAMMDNADDEHRVWYVGATRAREKLTVLLPMNQLHYQI